MYEEIKWAGDQSNPMGTPEERSQFAALCVQAQYRWRKEIKHPSFYNAVYYASQLERLVDTVTDGWHASEDEAILTRYGSDEHLCARDLTHLNDSAPRLGWNTRTSAEYMDRGRQLLAHQNPPSYPP